MPYKLPHPEAAPPKLDPQNVPSALADLIPYAELYGIHDDGYRIEMFQALDDSELNAFLQVFWRLEDELDDWLAGPDSESSDPSKEYLTFSAMRLCADLA